MSEQFSETYRASIGADFHTEIIKTDEVEVTFAMWDTAGQEKFRSLGTNHV